MASDAERGGWVDSAAGWSELQGEHGDWLRRWVLDPVIFDLVREARPRLILDLGAGNGRFARRLTEAGLRVVAMDPVFAFAADASRAGLSAVVGEAERLPFRGASFSLVLSYITLVDISDYRAAIAELNRVLLPGGKVVVANISSFASSSTGWVRDEDGNRLYFPVDNYLTETATWYEWGGIRILNYHRPLSAYMSAFLECGLILVNFLEPDAIPEAPPDDAHAYRRAPYAFVMVWEKPQ